MECEWDFAENTNSMYYKIYKDDVWLSFRISDHAKKQRRMPSITVGKSTTLQQVGKFVRNRIDCLKGLAAHRLFGRGKIVEEIPPDKYRVNFPGLGLKIILADYLTLE